MNPPLTTIGPEPDPELLMDDFAQSPRSLAELARMHRMSIPSMLTWARVPVNQRTLRAIRDLTDARTDLIVSGARSEAAHALRRLAVESDSAETQRKACVDLLRLGLPAPASKQRGAREPSTSGAAEAGTDGDALRRVLDAMAERTDAELAGLGDPDGPDAVATEHAA
jgi:hypothetical protein